MADAEIDIEDSDEEVEQTKAPQKTEAQRIREERLRKLQDLQLRKNEAVNLNRRETVEEDKREKLPKNWEIKKRRVEWELGEENAKREAEARGEDYERVKYMKLSAADAEKILEEKERREQGADHGFSDYRQANIRHYQKLTAQIKPDMNAYARELVTKGDERFYNAADTLTYGDAASTQGDNITRLVEDLEKQIVKRAKFSRRRGVHEDADIDYINEANMKFNRKAERFYGQSTAEIKQSLERGTAL